MKTIFPIRMEAKHTISVEQLAFVLQDHNAGKKEKTTEKLYLPTERRRSILWLCFNDSHRMNRLRIAKYPRNRPVLECVHCQLLSFTQNAHLFFFFGDALLYCVYTTRMCVFLKKYSLRIFIQLFKCFFFFMYVHTHTLYSVHTVRIRNAKKNKNV